MIENKDTTPNEPHVDGLREAIEAEEKRQAHCRESGIPITRHFAYCKPFLQAARLQLARQECGE